MGDFDRLTRPVTAPPHGEMRSFGFITVWPMQTQHPLPHCLIYYAHLSHSHPTFHVAGPNKSHQQSANSMKSSKQFI